MSASFDLSQCIICGGTGWGSPYSVPVNVNNRQEGLLRVFMPCDRHAPEVCPDRITIPACERRYPEEGKDYVIINDICLAGAPAVNGCCGDLQCVCAPARLSPNTRVAQTLPNGDRGPLHIVTDDKGPTFTLLPREPGTRMLINTPKDGWSLVGTRAFPADDRRSSERYTQGLSVEY